MFLLTGFYEDADPRRHGEFLECVRRNAANQRLGELHIFVEQPDGLDHLPAAYPPLAGPKVRLIAHGRRVMYADLFAYAGRHLAGRRVIIANADIYFDDTLAQLDGYDLAGKLLCLSRWDVQPDGSARLFEQPASQDVWIFLAPIPAFPCDFHLGVPGCDNRLAWEAECVGLAISNPARSLRAYHLHLSQVRRYGDSQRLEGPLRAIPAVFLETSYLRGPTPDVAHAGVAFHETMGYTTSQPQGGETVAQEVILALTSLSPAPENVALTQTCIKSWRDAGLQVHVFSHPEGIAALAKLYDVDFVPVAETTAPVFGKHFIPIKTMLDWAAERNVPALLINPYIDLRMTEWEIKRTRWISDGGLCYFIRHNHNGDVARAQPEPYSIDAFLLHGRDAALFPDSFLSMGQPFWDYWLPHTFAARGRPIYTVEFPAAFHCNHQQHWSWESWHRSGLEFARVSGEPSGDQSFAACLAMSVRVRQNFDRRKVVVPRLPLQIREWVQRRFDYPGPKLFIELGAHRGTDTAWMAEIPGVAIHAFEPDPRNHQPPRPNVTLHRAAIAERDGRGSLILSQQRCGQEWTHSSSIKPPKNHLHRFPVTFGGTVEVPLVALDTFYAQHGLDVVDFIWADIQGAEGEMIRVVRAAGHPEGDSGVAARFSRARALARGCAAREPGSAHVN
jgi:FkbM family methyltransferase